MCTPPRERIMNFTHASEVVTELRAQIEELSEFAKATVPRVEAAATQADLEELAERTAAGLGRLAVAIIRLQQRPTRRQRFSAWILREVAPIFTPHTALDERPL